MLLAVDIGNTNITLGVYKGEKYWGITPLEALEWLKENMIPNNPLGRLKGDK